MKKIYFFVTLLISVSVKAQVTYPSSNINLVGFLDPETVMGVDNIKYSGCWGYDQTSKNKEYAVVGSSTGTYFVDISAPATPTVCDYVAGAHPSACIWREVNVYQNYAYVVSDDNAPNSFQIIDMQYLPDSVHVVYDGKLTYFERAHTVFVDGNRLYVGGITFSGGGTANMRVYSLATPTAPALLRTLSQDYPSISYVHDMHVRNDTVFASCGNQGLQVYKFNGSNFSILGNLTSYSQSGYNHSSSWTADGKHLVFCDEVPTGLSIKLADVSNLGSITVPSLFRPTLNSGFVGHNPYVLGNKWALISCYEDGLYLYDISNPLSPTQAGYFDTYPQGGISFGNNYGTGSYNGNWGAYPYFKSGLILACDMQNGIFILEAYNLLGCSLAPTSPMSVAGNTLTCAGASQTYTTPAVLSATGYSWTLPGGWTGTSSTNTISATTNSASGNVNVAATNTCGTSGLKSLFVNNGTPTLSAATNNSLVCVGQSATLTASGASTYTWNPGGSGTSIVVNPTVTSTYSITGTSTAGCNNVTVFTQSVSSCAGIQENVLQGSVVMIFPNPTNGVLMVSGIQNNETVSVADLLGNILLSVKPEISNAEINLGELANGVYFIRVGRTVMKVLKN